MVIWQGITSKQPQCKFCLVIMLFSFCRFLSSFCVIALSVHSFCNHPSWVSKWSAGCSENSKGNTENSLQFLVSSLEDSKSDSDESISVFMSARISNEVASCLEKNGKWLDAKRLYLQVVDTAKLKNTVAYVNALRGLIRCRKELNEDVSNESKLLETICSSSSATYICKNKIVFVPYSDRADSGFYSVLSSIKTLFSIDDVDPFAELILKTYSGVVLLDINDQLLSVINTIGKNNFKDTKELIVFLEKQILKTSLPLLFPSNIDPKILSNHPRVLTSEIDDAIVLWGKATMKIMDFCSSNNKNFIHDAVEFLKEALKIVKGKSFEFESRILVELGMCYNDLGDTKGSLNSFLSASRLDCYGLTRSTMTAISMVLESAINSRSFSLISKSFRRAERLYIGFPKIVGIFGSSLIVESCRDNLEKVPQILSDNNLDINSVLFSNGVFIGPSMSILLWADFEKCLESIPSLGLIIKSWKSVNSVMNFFKKKKSSSPRSIGLLGDFLGDESKSDDI